MRNRVAVVFVSLVIVFTVFAASVYSLRTVTIQRELRQHDASLLNHTAVAVALAVDERTHAGDAVDVAFLRALVAPEVGVRYHPGSGGGDDVEVRGFHFAGSLDPERDSDDVRAAAATSGNGYVLVSEDAGEVSASAMQSVPQMGVAFVIVGLIAGCAGLLLGRWYVRPFRPLAAAAAALGRGRFQLDLPRSGVPEADAIAEALDASAHQLQDRLAGEDAFVQGASHALRTPLTGLRLELEDAALQEGLDEETAAALARSLQRVDRLEAVTGELIASARRRALVAQATIPLDQLARQITQHWADELDTRHRTMTAAVEGDAATTYTPGPVEQILEFLLVDVLHRSAGQVRVVFAVIADRHLKITVTAESPVAVRNAATAPLLRARAVAVALGGRLEGEYAGTGVEIVLPRR